LLAYISGCVKSIRAWGIMNMNMFRDRLAIALHGGRVVSNSALVMPGESSG